MLETASQHKDHDYLSRRNALDQHVADMMRLKVTSNSPLMNFALAYCLSQIDEESHFARIAAKYPESFGSNCEQSGKHLSCLTGDGINGHGFESKEDMLRCVADFVAREISRYAAGHRHNPSSHRAKNFQFIIRLDAFLSDQLFQDFLKESSESTAKQVVFPVIEVGKEKYWNQFLQRLTSEKVATPIMVMTDVLISNVDSVSGGSLLHEWQTALQIAREDFDPCFSEANKQIMKRASDKIPEPRKSPSVSQEGFFTLKASSEISVAPYISTLNEDDDAPDSESINPGEIIIKKWRDDSDMLTAYWKDYTNGGASISSDDENFAEILQRLPEKGSCSKDSRLIQLIQTSFKWQSVAQEFSL